MDLDMRGRGRGNLRREGEFYWIIRRGQLTALPHLGRGKSSGEGGGGSFLEKGEGAAGHPATPREGDIFWTRGRGLLATLSHPGRGTFSGEGGGGSWPPCHTQGGESLLDKGDGTTVRPATPREGEVFWTRGREELVPLPPPFPISMSSYMYDPVSDMNPLKVCYFNIFHLI